MHIKLLILFDINDYLLISYTECKIFRYIYVKRILVCVQWENYQHVIECMQIANEITSE